MSRVPDTAIRYVAVGCANTVFGYVVIYGCMLVLGLGTVASNAIGYGCGVVLSFFLNRTVTFRSKVPVGVAVPRFAMVTAVAYVANLATVVLLERVVQVDPYIAQACGLFPYLAVGYLGSRFFVFADSVH